MTGGIPFGRYTLERPLAAGGMAEILLGSIAGPEGFRKQVVIKRVLPKLVGDPDTTRMFLDEARLAARFNHPNLIQVYELFEVAGTYALAMEYLEGVDLIHLIRAATDQDLPVPFIAAAQITADAADGLHYAHELRGEDGALLDLVHRDISPSNVFISWSGNVKVVDFGVAKTTSPGREATRTGVIKGKIGYLSPEQADCVPLDRRTDIFALGIVLFETLTGQRCFRSLDVAETLERIRLADHVPVTVLRPDTPPALINIIDRALQPKADDRYPTAAAMRDELRGFLATCGAVPALGDTVSDLFTAAGDEARQRADTIIAAASDIELQEDGETSRIGPTGSVTEEDGRRRTEEMPPNFSAALAPEVEGSSTGVLDPRRRTTEQPNTTRLAELEAVAGPPEPRRRGLLVLGGGIFLVVLLATLLLGRALTDPSVQEPGSDQPTIAPQSDGSTLHILSEPLGAEIYVDGVHHGRAPTIVDDLTPGKPVWIVAELSEQPPKAVRVTPSADETIEVTVVIGRGQTPTGTITLQTQPPGAQLWLNSRPLAQTTPTALELEAGTEHELRLGLDGYRDKTITLRTTVGGAGKRKVTLAKETTARARATGRLNLTSEPRLDVFWRGRRIGRTPLKDFRLKAGAQALELRDNRLGIRRRLTLNVPRDGVVNHKVTLRKGKIVVNSVPWAKVFLGRRELGTTPVPPTELYEGSYTLRLENPELQGQWLEKVVVEPGKTTKVRAKHKP